MSGELKRLSRFGEVSTPSLTLLPPAWRGRLAVRAPEKEEDGGGEGERRTAKGRRKTGDAPAWRERLAVCAPEEKEDSGGEGGEGER